MIPLIGITGRRVRYGALREAAPTFADQTVTLFFSAFSRAVAAAGGLPICLPFEAARTDIVHRLDGLIVTGGADLDPSRWGGPETRTGDPLDDPGATDPDRDDYEAELLRAALDSGTPVLGVCRGHQLLNVILGGTLITDLPPGPIAHLATTAPPDIGHHEVATEGGTLARAVLGPVTTVNSWHHQAIDRLGDDLVVSGRSGDGVIEAVELPGRPVLGVQWHPEWHPGLDPTFAWLIDTARSAQVTAVPR